MTLSPFSGNFINGKEYFMSVMKQKQGSINDWVPVLRTEKLVFNQSLSPWKIISIPLDCLMNKTTEKKENEIPVRICLAQYNASGHHTICGYANVTVGRLVIGETLLELDEPINNSAYTLKICKCELFRTYSFLDYINNGCELNLTIGVDFTGSNMNVITGQNLHNSDLTQNQYYNAIQRIGGILLNFDSDKSVPLFGFGAMVDERYYNDISNLFALNGNIFRPEVRGIEGIENCYKKNMNNIMYSGPTYFAPLLKFWNEMVTFECEKNIKRYYIYLLLTDGTNHDIENTIEQVVLSSKLPVSIIIIGIGDADFSNMKFLDSDEQLLFSEKTQTFSIRDNVQFVEFNKYKHDLQKLAQETLVELPRQMIEYFKFAGINPEDLSVFQENLEMRDFFSYKAMQFITNENVSHLGYEETLKKIIEEGVASEDHIDLKRCLCHYENKLK